MVEDIDAIHRLKVDIDGTLLSADTFQQISFGLQGASFVESNLPENCNLDNTANDTNNELPGLVICDVIEPSREDVEMTLPVYIVPYEAHDFIVTAALVNEGILNIDSSFRTSISYIPNGQTELSINSDLANEIQRSIQIGSGTIVKSIHEGFRSLENCPDGGHIEEIFSPDFFFGTDQDRYVNCTNGAVVLDGKVSTGFGRESATNDLSDATMMISEPQLVNFTGRIQFSTVRNDPDTTVLEGQVEQIDSLGENITFSSYSSHCKAGVPIQPHQAYTLVKPKPILTVQATFESNDNFLNGSRLSVNIEAILNNQGTVTLESDNGSRINAVMANGPYPAIYIDLVEENQEERWIIPWADEYAFACQPWRVLSAE